jgi:hypothetical protein
MQNTVKTRGGTRKTEAYNSFVDSLKRAKVEDFCIFFSPFAVALVLSLEHKAEGVLA